MRNLRTAICFVLPFILAACGSDGSNSSSDSNKTSIEQVAIERPDLALQVAPRFHIDNVYVDSRTQVNKTNNGSKSNANNASQCQLTPTSAGVIDLIPVACLQMSYNNAFCQLNAEHGVTMQAPECQANIAYIKGQTGTGNFDLSAQPILNNTAGVIGVKFQPVSYTTTVKFPSGTQQTFNVSGGLLLPQLEAGYLPKGVVTYFHATAFNKSMVGSNFMTNGETQLVAEVFASQGYIVVIPDYIGQGVDWANVHPYVLYPQVTNQTAVDMLNAVKPTIQAAYSSLPATVKLFSAGYSEGGAYSGWFPAFLQTTPGTNPAYITQLNSFYSPTHFVGMEGAYATSSVMKGWLFGNVSQVLNTYHIQTQSLTNLAKPLLSADAFLSYATYTANSVMDDVFNMNWYNLQCPTGLPPPNNQNPVCTNSGKWTNISSAFATQSDNPAPAILTSAIGKTANGATYPTDLVASDKNSVNSLVSSTLLSTGQATLDSTLNDAQLNLTNFNTSQSSLSVISLDYDSVVTPNNYDWLTGQFQSKLSSSFLFKIPASQLKVVSPLSYLTPKPKPVYVDVDHLQGLVYEFLYAVNTFDQF